MFNFQSLLSKYILNIALSEFLTKNINTIKTLFILVIAVVIIDFIARKILSIFFARVTKSSNLNSILVANKIPKIVAHIVPLVIIFEFYPILFSGYNYVLNGVEKGLQFAAIILTICIIRSLLKVLRDHFKSLSRLDARLINNYMRVITIVVWILIVFATISIILNVPIWKFLSTIGAVSAVILLIFRDAILSFTASIQVSFSDIVRVGDWITFEKYKANGDVIEINLASVKIQNFDKTITSIPTRVLISDSFKNWKGMQNSGGRRIKRALFIKQASIKHLSNDEIYMLSKIELLTPILEKDQLYVKNYNSTNHVHKELTINGKNLTNIGVFGKYIEAYLEQHNDINKDMMIMVRQLAPTSQGVPLEVYAFVSEINWKNYEAIKTGIFSHLIASITYFDLEIFELLNNSSFIKKEHELEILL